YLVFRNYHSFPIGRLYQRRADRGRRHLQSFRRDFNVSYFGRSSNPTNVNLAQLRGDYAQIGAALVTKPAHIARYWGLALRAYVNHSEGCQFQFHACKQDIYYNFKPDTDAKSVCGLNQCDCKCAGRGYGEVIGGLEL